MEPLISVIVPVYNVEPYLRKCVDSILNQTYRNLEIILVDDGSPDGCGAICDEYAARDSRVKVIHKENGGQATARNAALDIATGEYVAFVDGDDWLDHRLYETVMNQLPFDIALFGCTKMNDTEEVIVRIHSCDISVMLNWESDSELARKNINNSLLGYAWSKVYCRSVIGDSYFPDVKLREDLLFAIAVCSKTNQIRLVNSVGYYYVQREGSTLSKKYSGKVPDHIIDVAERMVCIHPKLPTCINRDISDELIKQYLLDVTYKFVFVNESLSEKNAVKKLRDIICSEKIARMVRFRLNEPKLFTFLTLCIKLKAPKLFYRVMRRKWNG